MHARTLFGAAAVFLLGVSPPVAAAPLHFDITQPNAAAPPYPAATLEIDAVSGNPPDDGVPIEIIELTLENVCQPPEPCAPVSFGLSGTDTGGDVGLFGTEVNIEGSTPPDDGFPASGLSFSLLVELREHSAGSATPVMGINPCVTPSATGFDLDFEAEIPALGVAVHQLQFSVAPGQSISFSNIQVGALIGATFPVSFDLLPTGSIDETEPLFTATLTGTFTEAPGAPALPFVGLVLLCLLLVGSGLRALRRASDQANASSTSRLGWANGSTG